MRKIRETSFYIPSRFLIALDVRVSSNSGGFDEGESIRAWERKEQKIKGWRGEKKKEFYKKRKNGNYIFFIFLGE